MDAKLGERVITPRKGEPLGIDELTSLDPENIMFQGCC